MDQVGNIADIKLQLEQCKDQYFASSFFKMIIQDFKDEVDAINHDLKKIQTSFFHGLNEAHD